MESELESESQSQESDDQVRINMTEPKRKPSVRMSDGLQVFRSKSPLKALEMSCLIGGLQQNVHKRLLMKAHEHC